MDNRGHPEEYELPADEYSGWTVLARIAAGVFLGFVFFIAIIAAMAA